MGKREAFFGGARTLFQGLERGGERQRGGENQMYLWHLESEITAYVEFG